MNYECLICQVKALPKRMDKYQVTSQKSNQLVSQLIKDIAEINLNDSYSPEITSNILKKLMQESDVSDPYEKEKKDSNREMLERYDEFKQMIASSENPFDVALRLAIAGNIIDFGPDHKFDIYETIA
jgi:damage-control phosphatase, subfamily I